MNNIVSPVSTDQVNISHNSFFTILCRKFQRRIPAINKIISHIHFFCFVCGYNDGIFLEHNPTPYLWDIDLATSQIHILATSQIHIY